MKLSHILCTIAIPAFVAACAPKPQPVTVIQGQPIYDKFGGQVGCEGGLYIPGAAPQYQCLPPPDDCDPQTSTFDPNCRPPDGRCDPQFASVDPDCPPGVRDDDPDPTRTPNNPRGGTAGVP